MTLPPAIIAIDPGLTSGLAVITCTNDILAVAYSAELSPMQTGTAVRALLLENPDAQIVVERFVISSATVRNSPAPWSLEVIGMVKWLVYNELGLDPNNAVILQGPAEAKRLITNSLLKRFDLWHVGGAGHGNDAIRHAVYRFSVLGWRRPWEDLL